MSPASSDGISAGAGLDRVVVAGLCAVILASSVVGGLRMHALGGHLFGGAIAAAAFWFFANRLLAWIVAAKTRTIDPDAAADVPDDDPALAPVLAGLETLRIETAAEIDRRVRRLVPIGLAGGVLLWGWTQFSRDPGGLIELGFFTLTGAFGGYGWAALVLAGRYAATYKEQVLPRLAARFGALDYRKAIAPDAALLKQQRLFRHFDMLSADDEIFGSYRGVSISIVELKLTKRDGNMTRTVFDGLFTRVTLARTLTGTTAVIVDGGVFGNLRDAFGGDRVRLEDPAFERVYQVFGTDQIAARALLTPAFMQRFLTLGERTGFQRPLALAQGNDLTIALPKQGYDNLFEPPDYSRPAASRVALARLNGDIAAVLAVADAVIDLDQSLRKPARVGAAG